MKFVNRINVNTVLDSEVLDDYIACPMEVKAEYAFVNDNFEAAENGKLDEFEFERYNNALLALDAAGVEKVLTVGKALECFTEAERTAIINHINEVIDSDCGFTDGDVYIIRNNIAWYIRDELLEMFGDKVTETYTLWNAINDNMNVFDSEGELVDGEYRVNRVFAINW